MRYRYLCTCKQADMIRQNEWYYGNAGLSPGIIYVYEVTVQEIALCSIVQVVNMDPMAHFRCEKGRRTAKSNYSVRNHGSGKTSISIYIIALSWWCSSLLTTLCALLFTAGACVLRSFLVMSSLTIFLLTPGKGIIRIINHSQTETQNNVSTAIGCQ